MKIQPRIYLAPPHMGGEELLLLKKAFNSNWIAPVGPDLNQFEEEFARKVGAQYAAAVSSGTAALHLCLRYFGVSTNDEVLCSTFTFVATANAVLYQGGRPVFLDSEETTWNMDPELLADTLQRMAARNCLPKAVIVVHLYGQSADMTPILAVCEQYNVPLIEDAAEALGAEYKNVMPGIMGDAGIYSFNGNKIITTSGGGMVVSDNKNLIEKVKFWATQAREDSVHYQHKEMGYNYRMSNLLAAIGRGQLKVLEQRVEEKRAIYTFYNKALAKLPGVAFIEDPSWAKSSRWLSCLLINPDAAGIDRNVVIAALEEQNIESRPLWKPLHLQPLFSKAKCIGGEVSERLFEQGLCLPSGTAMQEDDLLRVVEIVRQCW